jgi:sigma-B regulation protein RsbQ
MDVLQRNNVKVIGKGSQVMMFAHGFGCDQSIWRYVTPAFEESFRIVLFDYVGCGGSDRSFYSERRYANLDGYTMDVLEIAAALHLEDIIFVGHSVSSMIGVLAARQCPELFRSMIMIGPSPCYVNEPGYQGGFDKADLEQMVSTIGVGTEWAASMANAGMGTTDHPRLTEELVSLFCSMDPAIAHRFAAATLFSDNRAYLQDHAINTLVIQGGVDVIAPVSVGEYIRRSMQNATLVKLDAVGHFPHLNAPRQTIDAMWEHLYQTWPQPTVPDYELVSVEC